MISKSGQDLTRYFPEIVTSAVALAEKTFVLDGELVVQIGREFSFDDLLQRIHPAVSRVKKLSVETPALFLAFDLLKKGKTSLATKPLASVATSAAVRGASKLGFESSSKLFAVIGSRRNVLR